MRRRDFLKAAAGSAALAAVPWWAIRDPGCHALVSYTRGHPKPLLLSKSFAVGSLVKIRGVQYTVICNDGGTFLDRPLETPILAGDTVVKTGEYKSNFVWGHRPEWVRVLVTIGNSESMEVMMKTSQINWTGW